MKKEEEEEKVERAPKRKEFKVKEVWEEETEEAEIK